jgi:hypothetical protein
MLVIAKDQGDLGLSVWRTSVRFGSSPKQTKWSEWIGVIHLSEQATQAFDRWLDHEQQRRP